MNLQTTSIAGEELPPMSERRNESRVPTEELVDVYQDNTFVTTVHLGDLSDSGAFLYSQTKALNIGETLEIRFPLSRKQSQNGKALCINGVVVRQTDDGVGVMITSKSMVSIKSMSDTITL